MSIHGPTSREDLSPASDRQLADMEALAYDLLKPQPVEASRSYGLMSALGSQAMIEVVWEEPPGKDPEPDTATIVICDADETQVLACAFNAQNEPILTSYRDDAEGVVLAVLDDLLSIEFDAEEMREILRFFHLMMFVALGIEDQETLRAVGGMDGDEQHVADKMRSLVMSKSEIVRRTRSYQRVLDDTDQSVVEVFENIINGIELEDVLAVPVLHIELCKREQQDTGWRYVRYPDDERTLEQFTPSFEGATDDSEEPEDQETDIDIEFELLEGELMEGIYTPQVGDVRRVTNALRRCVVLEASADSQDL